MIMSRQTDPTYLSLLADYLPRRRWFAGKGREFTVTHVHAAALARRRRRIRGPAPLSHRAGHRRRSTTAPPTPTSCRWPTSRPTTSARACADRAGRRRRSSAAWWPTTASSSRRPSRRCTTASWPPAGRRADGRDADLEFHTVEGIELPDVAPGRGGHVRGAVQHVDRLRRRRDPQAVPPGQRGPQPRHRDPRRADPRRVRERRPAARLDQRSLVVTRRATSRSATSACCRRSSGRPRTAGGWRSPASVTCSARRTCTPPRSAATSRPSPSGSVRRSPACTTSCAGCSPPASQPDGAALACGHAVPARRGPRRRTRARRVQHRASAALRPAARAHSEPIADPARARRSPPRTDPAHGQGLEDHRLRGRAGQEPRGAHRPVVAAARRRRDAALVRLCGRRHPAGVRRQPAARLPGARVEHAQPRGVPGRLRVGRR